MDSWVRQEMQQQHQRQDRLRFHSYLGLRTGLDSLLMRACCKGLFGKEGADRDSLGNVSPWHDNGEGGQGSLLRQFPQLDLGYLLAWPQKAVPVNARAHAHR